MFISRPTYANDLSAHIAITMDSISAGRKEVASFCAGTSLVAYAPKRAFTGLPAPVDDLSWWKPFLQLRGPEAIAGPAEARRLFNRDSEKPAAEKDICIDHSEDDVRLPSFNAASASIFTTMRNRSPVIVPTHDDDQDDDAAEVEIPAAYVVAERVSAPVELRFFPQRSSRAPTIVDC
jgi:hypothetical protein